MPPPQRVAGLSILYLWEVGGEGTRSERTPNSAGVASDLRVGKVGAENVPKIVGLRHQHQNIDGRPITLFFFFGIIPSGHKTDMISRN